MKIELHSFEPPIMLKSTRLSPAQENAAREKLCPNPDCRRYSLESKFICDGLEILHCAKCKVLTVLRS